MTSAAKDILERSRRFSVLVINLVRKFPRTAVGFVVIGRLVGSATSIGANTIEAQDASSRKDFINKLSIALRESRETKYWLMVIKDSGLFTGSELDRVIDEADQLCAIYSAIVKNAKIRS